MRFGRNSIFKNQRDSIIADHKYLWRFLVRTPTDFTGFDRRFIGDGLYLDAQEGENLEVCICIDTSGSVSAEELGQFRAEVLSILRCYPHINATLFYADADLYGPYHLKGRGDWPEPRGGAVRTSGPCLSTWKRIHSIIRRGWLFT